MNRISRLGRVAAAAVLVASGATVALTSTATAANTAISYDCVTQYTYLDVNNSDTLTITITANTGCGFIILNNPPGGALGTATLNGSPLTAGNPIATSNSDVIVYTAPASGNGQDGFVFLPNLQSQPGPQINITFPAPAPRNDTLVDNGDGSMTVTFDPLQVTQSVFINIFPSGTTCSSFGNPAGRLYVLTTSFAVPTPMTSPTTIAAGSPAYTFAGNIATSTTIDAGAYQACFYFSPSNGPTELVESLAITLAEVTPTTSTTTSPESTTTAAAGDPVVPAFTG
jgi:hypothetical protein